MWYTIDTTNGYDRKELISLYEIYEKRERGLREDLYRFTNFYSAVCYAILAATLSGVVSLYNKPIVIGLLFGPILTLFMCFLGIRVTKRIYKRIMYELSVKIKLENILGFDKPLLVAKFLGQEKVWENDQGLLPWRHAEKRQEHNNSKDFISSLAKSGFYMDNFIYFGLIAIFSFALGITIIVLHFVN